MTDFKVNRLVTNLNCCNNNQSEESHPENFARFSSLIVLWVDSEQVKIYRIK